MPPLRRMRIASAAAALVLFAVLASRTSPSEVSRRARFLERGASMDAAHRRLAGSATAFDRPFFVFLESARRARPASASGILLVMPDPSEPALHLAAYTWAPVPVRLSPAPLPPGWIAAVYGDGRPPGVRVLQALPGGALLAPAAP